MKLFPSYALNLTDFLNDLSYLTEFFHHLIALVFPFLHRVVILISWSPCFHWCQTHRFADDLFRILPRYSHHWSTRTQMVSFVAIQYRIHDKLPGLQFYCHLLFQFCPKNQRRAQTYWTVFILKYLQVKNPKFLPHQILFQISSLWYCSLLYRIRTWLFKYSLHS